MSLSQISGVKSKLIKMSKSVICRASRTSRSKKKTSSTRISREKFDTSVCYVDGCDKDREKITTLEEMEQVVWEAVKPPEQLTENNTPLVSGRKIELIRAQLLGKQKGK